MTTDCFVCDGQGYIAAAPVHNGLAHWDHAHILDCPGCLTQQLTRELP